MARPITPTAVQGEVGGPETGAVSGYLLKLIRSGIQLRQTDLAERLSVDVSTIQGWETGRRPLTALKASDLVRLRYRLAALGAPPVATNMLSEAVEADLILSAAIYAGDRPIPANEHPLATGVQRRGLVSLLTWPFTGIVPAQIRPLPTLRSRGPVADRPVVDKAAQERIFDHMLVTADAAPASETLLRRQATYLLGFDHRPTSADWLAREHRRTMAQSLADKDIPAVIAARSAALALARQGDPEPVRRYIQNTSESDAHTLAALTYWAYWLGEVPDVYGSDGEMVELGGSSWSGVRLIDHLLAHLRDPQHADLNVHGLWTLILARPGLLERDADLRHRAATSIEAALDEGLGGHAHRTLTRLQCAIELAAR